jgi:hypothetical protein
MSNAPIPPEAGDESQGRPRPTGLRLTDASMLVSSRLPAPDGASLPPSPPPPAQAAEAEQSANPDVLDSQVEDPQVADPPAAEEARPATQPADGAHASAPPLPMMLPPSLASSDDSLPPMLDEFGPTDENAGPLRFLRDPVKYVGAAVDQPAAKIAPPAVEPAAHGFEQGSVALDEMPQSVERVPDPEPIAEARAAPAGADVSPILGALDAADAQAAGPRPESFPFALNIRVPRASPPAQVASPEAPAEAEDAGHRNNVANATDHFPDQGLRFNPSMLPMPPTPSDWETPSPEQPPAFAEAALHPAEPDAGMNAADHAPEQYAGSAPSMSALPPDLAVAAALEPPAAAEEASRPADPVREAAAKIAAEATATAAALENLKRLLEHKLPTMDVVTPPPQVVRRPLQAERPRERVAPPHSPTGLPVRTTAGLPPYIAAPRAAPPLPIPLFEPSSSSGGRLYLLGFLAGFGLALMAGAMLYVFISIG